MAKQPQNFRTNHQCRVSKHSESRPCAQLQTEESSIDSAFFSCLVVDLPILKNDGVFVNGKDNISYMTWKIIQCMFQTTKQMIFDVNVNFMSLMMVEHPPNQNSLHRTSILWQSVRSGSHWVMRSGCFFVVPEISFSCSPSRTLKRRDTSFLEENGTKQVDKCTLQKQSCSFWDTQEWTKTNTLRLLKSLAELWDGG